MNSTVDVTSHACESSRATPQVFTCQSTHTSPRIPVLAYKSADVCNSHGLYSYTDARVFRQLKMGSTRLAPSRILPLA
jgi:hypothetical protein